MAGLNLPPRCRRGFRVPFYKTPCGCMLLVAGLLVAGPPVGFVGWYYWSDWSWRRDPAGAFESLEDRALPPGVVVAAYYNSDDALFHRIHHWHLTGDAAALMKVVEGAGFVPWKEEAGEFSGPERRGAPDTKPTAVFVRERDLRADWFKVYGESGEAHYVRGEQSLRD